MGYHPKSTSYLLQQKKRVEAERRRKNEVQKKAIVIQTQKRQINIKPQKNQIPVNKPFTQIQKKKINIQKKTIIQIKKKEVVQTQKDKVKPSTQKKNIPSSAVPSSKKNIDRSKLNTHHYDGKLYLKRDEIDNMIAKIDQTKKKDAFEKLTKNIKKTTNNNNVHRCLNALVNNCNRKTSSPNYDSINMMYADDLLYLCCQAIEGNIGGEDNDVFDLLIHQLNEMASGMCPQGRTTRLYQIIAALDIS